MPRLFAPAGPARKRVTPAELARVRVALARLSRYPVLSPADVAAAHASHAAFVAGGRRPAERRAA